MSPIVLRHNEHVIHPADGGRREIFCAFAGTPFASFSLALFLIGRALRMPSQEFGQRQGRSTDGLWEVGAVRKSVARLAALHFYLARS
jgi:hypothetical protein